MKEPKLPRKFRLAKLASYHSDYSIKIGAVIYKGNRVVSFGFNYLKSHPIFANKFASIHSEISAILKAKTDLTGCHIYVFREYKNKKFALALPCKECMKAIIEAGITRIYYTTSDDSYYKEIKL